LSEQSAEGVAEPGQLLKIDVGIATRDLDLQLLVADGYRRGSTDQKAMMLAQVYTAGNLLSEDPDQITATSCPSRAAIEAWKSCATA
jgi:hypothetical protein